MSRATKSGKVTMSAGLLAAIASSICCIGPLVAGIAGISGAASSFSWMEPLRPYLIGFTVLALGFAFYQAYKPKEVEVDCCAVEEAPKKRFFQTRSFLWIVTVFSIIFLTFPYYNGIFYGKTPDHLSEVFNQSEHFQVTFSVEGMTCSGCEHHIEGDLGKTEGVLASNASYDDGTTNVTFDGSKLSKEKVIEVINATGYTVTGEIHNETTNGD